MSGKPVGSTAARQFIEEVKPEQVTLLAEIIDCFGVAQAHWVWNLIPRQAQVGQHFEAAESSSRQW